MKITPLGNRILVKLVVTEEKTAGGIYLPETLQQKPLEGTVVEISDSNYDEKGKKISFNVSVGDRLTFALWGSELEFDHENDTYAFIIEDSIVGKLK